MSLSRLRGHTGHDHPPEPARLRRTLAYRVVTSLYRTAVRLWQMPAMLFRRTRVHRSARVGPGAILLRCAVGAQTYIARGVLIADARIGNYCSIAAGVKVGGMEHAWWWGSTSPRLSNFAITGKVTTIGHDVWIGVNAVVRQGVTLGSGCVVGAGAVVLKDVAPYAIVVGIPAREIRRRFPPTIIAEIEASRFWELSPSEAARRLHSITYPDERGSAT